MKFITNNGLNENLHEFFEYIVKPYIKKEVKIYKKENFVFDANKLETIIKVDGASHTGLQVADDGSVFIYSHLGKAYIYDNGELVEAAPLSYDGKSLLMMEHGNAKIVSFPNGNRIFVGSGSGVTRVCCVKKNGEVIDAGFDVYNPSNNYNISYGQIASFNKKAFAVAQSGSATTLKVSSDGENWEDYVIQDFGVGKISFVYDTEGYLFVCGSVGVAVVRVKEYSGVYVEEVLENKFIISAASTPAITNPVITENGKVYIAYNNISYYANKFAVFDNIESLNDPHMASVGSFSSFRCLYGLKKANKVIIRTDKSDPAERMIMYHEDTNSIGYMPTTPPNAADDNCMFTELTNGDIINYDALKPTTSIGITRDLVTYENVNVTEDSQLIRSITQDSNGNVYIALMTGGIKKLTI